MHTCSNTSQNQLNYIHNQQLTHTNIGVIMTNILVQNIETFATITTFPDMDAFDAWMDTNGKFGIVSLDADADGNRAACNESNEHCDSREARTQCCKRHDAPAADRRRRAARLGSFVLVG